ncbi:hypothetical protein EsH8_I_000404 [Colletotrichum jinshuiense]
MSELQRAPRDPPNPPKAPAPEPAMAAASAASEPGVEAARLKRNRSFSPSLGDINAKRKKQESSTRDKPVFGSLQATWDAATDEMIQISNSRTGRAVIDHRSDDTFVFHGPSKQLAAIMAKMMKACDDVDDEDICVGIFRVVRKAETGNTPPPDPSPLVPSEPPLSSPLVPSGPLIPNEPPAPSGPLVPSGPPVPRPLVPREIKKNPDENWTKTHCLSSRLDHLDLAAARRTSLTQRYTENRGPQGGYHQSEFPTSRVASSLVPSLGSERRGQISSASYVYQQGPQKNEPYPPNRPTADGIRKKHAPNPNTHPLSIGKMFMNRDAENANVTCGNCSGRGHGLIDCIWPDASGFIYGCPACNTKEHSLDDCPHRGNWEDKMWCYVLIYRRARKPPIKTVRSWAEIAAKAPERGLLDFLKMGFPWTSLYGRELQKYMHSDMHVWLTYDYSNDSLNQGSLPFDPVTKDLYTVLGNPALRRERHVRR